MPTLQNEGIYNTSYSSRYISHVAKIKPASVLVYKKYVGFKTGKTEAELQNLTKGRDGEYNGYMSPATTRKVRTILENWLLAIEREITNDWQIDSKVAFANSSGHDYYPTFVTLTLPSKQIHDDNYIKRNLLNRFIINLKSVHKVEHYFWRAEPQRNGNIHFHILVDRWIHWKAIRYDWNKILNNHGYIELYRTKQSARHKNGYRPDIAQIHARVDMMQERARAAGKKFNLQDAKKKAHEAARKAYEEGIKNNWSDPNSTDIHAIEKVDSITAYVVKYVTKKADHKEVTQRDSDGNEVKGVGDRQIKGRIWGKSDGLEILKHFEREIAEEHDYHVHTHDNPAFDLISHLDADATARQLANPDDDSVWRDEDSGTVVYKLDQRSYALLRTAFPQLFAQYSDHYKQMYGELYSRKQLLSNNITDSVIMFDLPIEFPGTIRHAKTNTIPDFSNWHGPVTDCPF